MENNGKLDRRIYGIHFTSVEIFNQYILPQIRDSIQKYLWVDLFCGEGNLIVPLLNLVPEKDREQFFSEHILCFDIKEDAIDKAVGKAMEYGIPKSLARERIKVRDTLKDYPQFESKHPVFHITNPPYLYLGYIRKHEKAVNELLYFRGRNKGYQDLYQIALMNDLRHEIKNMIYIIPSNFLFADAGSNKIREDFLKYYKISNCFIFEKKIFTNTGTNVLIARFERTDLINRKIVFNAYKINSKMEKLKYTLLEQNRFKPNNQYIDYLKDNFKKDHLRVSFYLDYDEILNNSGDHEIVLLNSKKYSGGKYTKEVFHVNESLYRKLKSNPLFIRTVDTGSPHGKAGIYSIQKEFAADGIYVVGATYRTNPIQIFIEPRLSEDENICLMELFNKILNDLRERTGGDFLTTYKYSANPKYVRKYLGLKKVKELLKTISVRDLRDFNSESLAAMMPDHKS